MLISLLSFIVVIAVCVIVHESGHYWTAKKLGVQSHEFSFGMGPALFQRKDKDGMLWSLRLLPLGGFVRLAGMGEENDDEVVKEGMGFNEKAAWRRFLILANGSVMNIVLAILLTAFFLYGHGVMDMQSTRIGSIMEGLPAEKAQLLTGDRIVRINGAELKDWRDMTAKIRGGALKGPVLIDVERGGETFAVTLNIPTSPEYKMPLLGITPSIKRYSPYEAVTSAWSYVMEMSADMLRGIWAWISQTEDMEISGPVGIASLAGRAARSGAWSFITFLALISLNLGLLNLLPFPALDGGRLFFVAGEMIFRRRLPDKVEQYIHFTGFAMLIALILFVTWQDILRLIK